MDHQPVLLLEPEGLKVQLPADSTFEQFDAYWEQLAKTPWKTLYDFAFQPPFSSDPLVGYLLKLAALYAAELSSAPELEIAREKTEVTFDQETQNQLLLSVPYVLNAALVTKEWIDQICFKLHEQFVIEAENWQGSMKEYFLSKNDSLQVSQKVFFHIVENQKYPEESEHPFAFLATYTILDEQGKVRHVPLSYVLKQYDKSDPKLIELLSALSKAADVCNLLDELIVDGEIFHPIYLDEKETWQLLCSIEELKKIGIQMRIPNWWKKKASSASLSFSLGSKKPQFLDMKTILSLRPSLYVNGKKLTKSEIRQMLEMSEGLHFIKGQWVEVDHKKLTSLLEAMDQAKGEMTLKEALALQAGLSENKELEGTIELENMKWLASLLNQLKHPETIRSKTIPRTVKASLRPYQKEGVNWLSQLGSFGLGACLGDDMGLGKTLQVLCYLESRRKADPDLHNLLIAPASLLGNWASEIRKFTPGMPFLIVHQKSREELEEIIRSHPSFLIITTYGMATRLEALKEVSWDILILDEAQAIKNPKTKQTRAVKSIPAKMKIALTGTPVENDLSNLWSLFDFLNPGLLGTSKEFGTFAKKLNDEPENYGRLKNMLAPFLLRRLKTDSSIIKDLPEKMEQIDYVTLSKEQTALYHHELEQLEARLEQTSGIQRKGMVLGALTHLKQICNHPDQYNGQHVYNKNESGKFLMLEQICESIRDAHECVLVFTQYREIMEDLNAFLAEVFQAPGLMIHGQTPAEKRTEYAEKFNSQQTYIPYMILSLKAAGTGLNLTAASHVIHFDRWWNPAVENQATDRAYRIGQKKNVVVHKFVCSGTIEERIEEMIESKKELAEKVIGDGQGAWLSELSNEELMNMLRLQ